LGLSFDQTERVMTMWKAMSRMQRRLAVASGLAIVFAVSLPGYAAEPSAAGLWQKTDDGKPVIWILMVDHHDGTFEGIMARKFVKPGMPETVTCAKCTDDRKDATVLGISFIRDMKRNGFEYEGGNILDPRDGQVWKAKMTLSPDGQALTLRGYVLTPLLGKDDVWQRLPDSDFDSVDRAIIAKYLPGQAVAAKQPGKKSASPR
jgi:hypothetical protein